MDLAVFELRHPDRDRLRALTRHLLDRLQLLAQLLRLLDLADHALAGLGIAVEQIDDDVAHPGDELGADLRVSELVLRLRLENRVLKADGHGPQNALAHVVPIELLLF